MAIHDKNWDAIRKPFRGSQLKISRQLGFVSQTLFPSQFKFDGISFHSHLDSNTVIATNFCTWHDSCAVVACAYFLPSDGQQRIYSKVKFLSNIRIAVKLMFVKRTPELSRPVKIVTWLKYHCLSEKNTFSTWVGLWAHELLVNVLLYHIKWPYRLSKITWKSR